MQPLPSAVPIYRADKSDQPKENQEQKAAKDKFLINESKIVGTFINKDGHLKNDFEKCVKNLCDSYYFDFKTQFGISETINELEDICEKIRTQPVNDRDHVFILHSKRQFYWVLICVIYPLKELPVVLYKDTAGESDPNVEKIFMKFSALFISNESIDLPPHSYRDSGIACLKNLEIIFKLLYEAKVDDLIINFKNNIKFCVQNDINKAKLNLILFLSQELSIDFTHSLNKFVEDLPFDLSKDIENYKQSIQQEIIKKIDEIDYTKLKSINEQFLKEKQITKFCDNYKLTMQPEKNKYEIKIQQEFPKEMKKLQQVLKLLTAVNKVKKISKLLIDRVSDSWNIKREILESFYEGNVKNKKIKQSSNNHSIADIVGQLPKLKNVTKASSIPITQLLTDVNWNLDDDVVHQLKSDFEKMEIYYKRWNENDINSISEWVKKNTNKNDISEMIAIINRTLHLITGDICLSNFQILAILTCLHRQENRGLICEISENRFMIVAVLAVIKALQGHYVDIVTKSNVTQKERDLIHRFYSVFDLSIAWNGDDFNYKTNVIYATLQNFQIKYLKYMLNSDKFIGRTKDGLDPVIILDEIDDMIIENSGQVAVLAESFPGMECLRYIYINIWQELHKVEKTLLAENVAVFSTTASKKNENILTSSVRIRKLQKEMIKNSFVINYDVVPNHLREYVKSKSDLWVKNAVYAKYDCHENVNYKLIKDNHGELIVKPMTRSVTGTTFSNTIWSNGLYQFIQLKHNLQLTIEELPTCFISNLGYIRQVYKADIFAFTAIAISKTEEQFLKNLYNVDCIKISTQKPKKFEEVPGIIEEDDVWDITLTLEVAEKCDDKIPVLVMLEKENDLHTVKRNLEVLKDIEQRDFKIEQIEKEDRAEESKNQLEKHDIILTTNIGVSQLKFTNDKKKGQYGNQHVCIGFLPSTHRGEKHILDETFRHKGTTQMIIKQSELQLIGINDKCPTFKEIKIKRDFAERQKLVEIKKTIVKKMVFKDEIFYHFNLFYLKIKRKNLSNKVKSVLKDIKELWATWIDKQNFENIKNTTPQKEFSKFRNSIKEVEKGKIIHNPYYSLFKSEFYVDNLDQSEARIAIANALNTQPLLGLNAGLHLRLFEITVMFEENMMNKLKTAFAKMFVIKNISDANYKSEVNKHLENARTCIELEIDCLDKFLNVNIKHHNGFKSILRQTYEGKNILLKHLNARLFCLKTIRYGVANLLKNLKSEENEYTVLKYALNVDNKDKLENIVSNAELDELQSIGLNVFYFPQLIQNVTDLKWAELCISAGITARCIGQCFEPAYNLSLQISSVLIPYGIMTIVLRMLNLNDKAKLFVMAKFICFDFETILKEEDFLKQFFFILSKALQFNQEFSEVFENNDEIKKHYTSLTKEAEKIESFFQRDITADRFSSLITVDQLKELTRLKIEGDIKTFNDLGGEKYLIFLQNLRKIGVLENVENAKILHDTHGKNVEEVLKKTHDVGVLDEKLVYPLVVKHTGELATEVKGKYQKILEKSILNSKDLKEKLRTIDPADLNKILDGNVIDTARIGNSLATSVTGKVENSATNIFTLDSKAVATNKELKNYAVQTLSELAGKLIAGTANNNIKEVVKDVSKNIANQISATFQSAVGNVKSEVGNMEKANLDVDNPYSMLNLPKNVGRKMLKRGFRRMVLLYHPDRNPGNQAISVKYKLATDAYKAALKTIDKKNWFLCDCR